MTKIGVLWQRQNELPISAQLAYSTSIIAMNCYLTK